MHVRVVEVGGTKILVAFLEDGRQVVVYRNYVAAEFDTSRRGGRKDEAKLEKAKAELAKKEKHGQPTPAMILPFPYEPGQPPVEFFALDPKETLFADLKSCFPTVELLTLSNSATERRNALEVKQVGSYNVSVAY